MNAAPAFTRRLLGSLLALLLVLSVRGQVPTSADWLEPHPPFKIAGNLYWVGGKDLASYLVVTPQGCILINSGLEANVPMIQASVEQLGFKFTDIKVLLISHAHWDHAAGGALVKQLTGASYQVMAADVPVVESGGRTDFHYGAFPGAWYPPAKVDRVLHDGDTVRLGDAILVAHLTAGHTKGCTTWTLKVPADGRVYDAVIVGSPNVNDGYKLTGNAAYPRIADDYENTFRVLQALPCDLFLGAHGNYFDMLGKLARRTPGAANPFLDPDGYRRYVAEREAAFRAALAQQLAPAAQP